MDRGSESMEVDLHEKWSNGVELSFAWRYLPDLDLLDQYDASGPNFDAREFVIHSMQMELASRLAHREFLAIGVKISADSSERNLVFIPSHFFAEDAACDFDNGAVAAFGIKFQSVRVIDFPSSPRLARIFVNQQQALEGASNLIVPVAAPIEKPTKVGRPPTMHLLRPIVLDLKNTSGFNRMPRKQQFESVRRAARERHPEKFKSASQPSDDTIFKVLRDEGL